MVDKVGTGQPSVRHLAGRPLGHDRVHLERAARARRRRRVARDVSRGVPPGHGGARGDPRHRRATITRITGSAGSPTRRFTRSSILFARDVAERDRCEQDARAHTLARSAACASSVSSGPRGDPAATAPREHFGYRDRLSEVPIEGTGDEPTPGSGRAGQGGRVLPRLRRRERRCARAAAARRCCRAMAATSRICGWRSTSARSANSCEQHGRHARGAGTRRREADGALAQRRAAGARAGEGRPGARRGPAAHERFRLRRDGSARLRAARWARTSGA